MHKKKILIISVIVIILLVISKGNLKTKEASKNSKTTNQTGQSIEDTFGKEFSKKNINDVLTESIVRASQQGRIDSSPGKYNIGMFYPSPMKKDSIKILNISDVYTYLNDEAIWQNVVDQLGNDFGQSPHADKYPCPEMCFVEIQADVKTNSEYAPQSIVIQLFVNAGYVGGLGTTQDTINRGNYCVYDSWEESKEEIKKSVKSGIYKKKISKNAINKDKVETMVNQQLIELNELKKNIDESMQENNNTSQD